MRQKLAFACGLLLGAAIIRLLAHRRLPSRSVDRRAEELRLKLAARREASLGAAPPVRPQAPAQDAATERLEPSGPDGGRGDSEVEATRKRIYEEGRTAVEEMRRSGEASP